VNICALWKRAEPKSGTHAHVQEISVREDGTASSMSPSYSYCCTHALQHCANGLCESEVWNQKVSMGEKGSSWE
jgi:hypothetical protein